MTDCLPPFTGDNPTCAQCGHRGAATEYRPHGHCLHPTEAVMGFDPNPRMHRTCDRCGHVWDEATAGQAREDGHTGACDATRATDAPGATEAAPGAHTPAQDLDEWREAADALLNRRDRWTQAIEQRNTRLRNQVQHLQRARKSDGKDIARLRAELDQLRADVDHRDQTIRHLENGLRHERHALADARDYLNQVPNHHINSQARADLNRRLEPAPADGGEVLPDELLRLLDMRKYVSTACDTAGACETATEDHADKLTERAAHLHDRCRRTHKFTGQPCACGCHHTTAKETS